MATKPITFCAEMVRALQNTKPDVWPAEPVDSSKPSKSQTRRLMKPQPPGYWGIPPALFDGEYFNRWGADRDSHSIKAPYQPGDVLWVREGLQRVGIGLAVYASDGARAIRDSGLLTGELYQVKWRWKRDYLPAPSMPNEAARLFVVVKSVGVERLRDITPASARAEGLSCAKCCNSGVSEFWIPGNPDPQGELCSCDQAVEAFAALWDDLNAKRGHPWETNPWVWRIEFMRTEKTDE